eukprot:8902756-Pyramimonas_sp.AAC.1
MPALWTQRRWNAGWACRRCHILIWSVAPGTLDYILDQQSSRVYPAAPAKREAAAEVIAERHDIA